MLPIIIDHLKMAPKHGCFIMQQMIQTVTNTQRELQEQIELFGQKTMHRSSQDQLINGVHCQVGKVT